MGLPGTTHSSLGAGAATGGASSAPAVIPATGGSGASDTSVTVAGVASTVFTHDEKMELNYLSSELLKALDARVSSHISNRAYFEGKIKKDFNQLEQTVSKSAWKRVLTQTQIWLQESYPRGSILPALKELQDFIHSHEGHAATKIKISLTADEIKDIEDSFKGLNTAIIEEITVITRGTLRVEPGKFEALLAFQKTLPIYRAALKIEGLDKSKIRDLYKQLETQKKDPLLHDFAGLIGDIQNKLIER